MGWPKVKLSGTGNLPCQLLLKVVRFKVIHEEDHVKARINRPEPYGTRVHTQRKLLLFCKTHFLIKVVDLYT